MTATVTNSLHYEMVMKIMDELEINMAQCHKIIDSPDIPKDIKKNLQSFCDQQKKIMASMTVELSELENTNRILLKENLIDEMTGLFQKKHLLPVIQRHIQQNHRSNNVDSDCIVVIDVNNMKKLNADYGHFGADDILVKITELTRSFLRENDYAFRVGGDEFVFYATGVKAEDITRIIIKRIYEHLKLKPIKAVLLVDSDKKNPPESMVEISFCLGAVNLPKKMPNDIDEIEKIISKKLREADVLEITAKNHSGSKESVAAYKNENGDTIIKTQTEIMAE